MPNIKSINNKRDKAIFNKNKRILFKGILNKSIIAPIIYEKKLIESIYGPDQSISASILLFSKLFKNDIFFKN
ncbi:MAG: hypothetical protein QXV60_03915, partial [Nitrososphaerota archaeon]